jgi:hypothetical protein
MYSSQSGPSSYTTTGPQSPSQSCSQSFSGSNQLLSPNSARMQLPTPSGSDTHQQQPRYVEVPTVPNSPLQPHVPLGFAPISQHPSSTVPTIGVPIGVGNGATVHVPAFGLANDAPSGPPVIPGDTSLAKGGSAKGRNKKSGQSRGGKKESYAVAPVPDGVTYPNAPTFRTGGDEGRTSPRPIPVPAAGMTTGHGGQNMDGSGLRHVPSNASITSTGSYSKFDSRTYLDPAYYGRGEGSKPGAGAGMGGAGNRSPYAGVANLP